MRSHDQNIVRCPFCFFFVLFLLLQCVCHCFLLNEHDDDGDDENRSDIVRLGLRLCSEVNKNATTEASQINSFIATTQNSISL